MSAPAPWTMLSVAVESFLGVLVPSSVSELSGAILKTDHFLAVASITDQELAVSMEEICAREVSFETVEIQTC